MCSYFRWYTIAPNAVQHYSTEDHTYKGMYIPKGSILIPNAKYVDVVAHYLCFISEILQGNITG
jgi:hypothetical protein